MPLSSAEFRTQWEATGDRLRSFSEEHLADLPLSPPNRAFLLEAGLPHQAAPFLAFRPPTSGSLPTVADTWDLPSDFPPAYVIGSNGSGDPVCIALDGRVYSFNHDNEFIPELIASSIPQLASILLAFREVVAYTQAVNGSDAFLDNRFPEDIRAWFKEQLQQIDPAVLDLPSLWQSELERWGTGSAA